MYALSSSTAPAAEAPAPVAAMARAYVLAQPTTRQTDRCDSSIIRWQRTEGRSGYYSPTLLCRSAVGSASACSWPPTAVMGSLPPAVARSRTTRYFLLQKNI